MTKTSEEVLAAALEEEFVKHANKTVTLGGQNYKAILLEDVLSVIANELAIRNKERKS